MNNINIEIEMNTLAIQGIKVNPNQIAESVARRLKKCFTQEIYCSVGTIVDVYKYDLLSASDVNKIHQHALSNLKIIFSNEITENKFKQLAEEKGLQIFQKKLLGNPKEVNHKNFPDGNFTHGLIETYAEEIGVTFGRDELTYLRDLPSRKDIQDVVNLAFKHSLRKKFVNTNSLPPPLR